MFVCLVCACVCVLLSLCTLQVVSVCYLSQLRGCSITPANSNRLLSHSRVALPDTIYTQKIEQINRVSYSLYFVCDSNHGNINTCLFVSKADDVVRDLVLNDVCLEDRGNPEETTVLSFILIGPVQDRQNATTSGLNFCVL